MSISRGELKLTYIFHKRYMCIKNGVPGGTRDAATAEAVWGAPRLAVITADQQKRSVRNIADKKSGANQ
jgi:hypothetical protein